MVLLQEAANEVVAKKTQAKPVTIRFNPPRFLRAIPLVYDPTIAPAFR